MSSEDTWNALTRDEVLVFFNAMDRHVDLVRATKSKIGGGIWPTCQIYFNNTQSMVIHSPEMNATAFSLLAVCLSALERATRMAVHPGTRSLVYRFSIPAVCGPRSPFLFPARYSPGSFTFSFRRPL